MNGRISSSSVVPASPVGDIASTDSQKEHPVILNPTKSHFQNSASSFIDSSSTLSQESLMHVKDVTRASSEAALPMSREEIAEAVSQCAAKLAPFCLPDDKETPSQIFIFNEKGDQIELHENTLETNLTIEASHEAVKEYFVNQLTALYGAAATNVLYPKKERSLPLTLDKAQNLIKSFAELQNSVMTACDGDLLKYDSCLAAQLKTLEELKTAVANPRPASHVESSIIDYLAKQTGLPSSMIAAGLMAGGVLVASAATSGLTFPVAFHTAAMTAFAHSTVLGATAANVTGASHMSAAIGTTNGVSAGLTGIWMGMSTSLLNAHYGTTALTALSHLSATTEIAAGTGAFVGAIGGGVAAAGTAETPSSTGRIVQGMLTGAALGSLLGGLSATFSPSVVGTTVAVTGGSVGALTGTLTGGQNTGTRGAFLGAVRGAATGLAVGGAITLFGGLCSAVAASAVTAAGTAPTIGEIAIGTAIAGYVAASGEINNSITAAIGTARAMINNHTPPPEDRPNAFAGALDEV